MNAVAESTFPLSHNDTKFVDWRALFAWEWRRIAGQRVFWCVAALLAAAFCAGALSGGGLTHEQQAAQTAQAAADGAWLDEVRQRARDYARPAAEPAPYWQDPTDVAGFSRYQLRQHAYKPVLPLATLAVGVGDLAPTRWPVKLDTLFGVEPVYDFEPPRSLALGRFDLGFAVVTILPVAVIALAGLLGTFERDRGMLRLIAAQTTTPLAWLSARVLALAAWLLPAVMLALSLALLVGGADPVAAWPEWLAALLLTAAYALFWLALAFFVLSAWPGAAAAIGSLLSLWLVFAVALPLLVKFAADLLQPPPSRVLYVDAQRRVEAALAQERDALAAAALAARADLAAHAGRAASLDYATRQTLLVPVTEARLADWQSRLAEHAAARETLSALCGYLAPPLGLETALATLSGGDMTRHRRYEAQVRAYQIELREFFWPRIQREIAAPTPRPPGSYARLNFSDYAAIPAYAALPETAAARVRTVLPLAAWLIVLSGLLALAARQRLRHWPAEL